MPKESFHSHQCKLLFLIVFLPRSTLFILLEKYGPPVLARCGVVYGPPDQDILIAQPDMADPLISIKTRNEFRELFVSTTLRVIDEAFGSAGVRCDLNYEPPVSGQRRILVEQYYHTVDWMDVRSVARVLKIYEGVLDELYSPFPDYSAPFGSVIRQNNATRLLHWLKLDGYERVGGKLVKTDAAPVLEQLAQATKPLEGQHLVLQIQRMRDAVETDPALAIGTAKELIETVCKTILAERGKPVQGTPDMPALTKTLLKELKLVPEGVSDSARGADLVKGILRSLGTIGNDLGQLRGLYGTGHGQVASARSLKPRHAKLAVGAAATFVTFVYETHQDNPINDVSVATGQ